MRCWVENVSFCVRTGLSGDILSLAMLVELESDRNFILEGLRSSSGVLPKQFG